MKRKMPKLTKPGKAAKPDTPSGSPTLKELFAGSAKKPEEDNRPKMKAGKKAIKGSMAEKRLRNRMI